MGGREKYSKGREVGEGSGGREAGDEGKGSGGKGGGKRGLGSPLSTPTEMYQEDADRITHSVDLDLGLHC